MYYEEEQATDIIGCSCTLLTPYKGYTEGEVVGDYGSEIVVRLNNGKEVVEYRDEVLIYDDTDSDKICGLGYSRTFNSAK